MSEFEMDYWRSYSPTSLIKQGPVEHGSLMRKSPSPSSRFMITV